MDTLPYDPSHSSLHVYVYSHVRRFLGLAPGSTLSSGNLDLFPQ